jgi:tripartite-type tricarboxylate transporter receptor subunit TctC
MKFSRREFLHRAAQTAALSATWQIARAQTYPSRPVRLIVDVGAGGAPDIMARIMGRWLSERLGQPFVVENRPGGAGSIGTEAVVRAPADGYTLLLVLPSHTVNSTLYPNLNYNFLRDIAPVAGISRDTEVMVVNPSFPAHSVPEFIAYTKANPGKINMASPGIGSLPHMAGELFKYMTGIDMAHVAYRSSAPAIADLFGGQVQVYFAPISAVLEYVRSGKLRALAVTTAARAATLPDIPTVGEIIPGYEASSWYGIGAPGKTPAEIVDRLNKEINAGLADPGVIMHLAALGSSPFPVSPAAFAKFIAGEVEKWAKVIKFANIRPE